MRSAVHNCRAHEWDPAEPRNPHYHVVAGHYCFVLRCLNDSTDRFQESVDMTYDSEDSLRKCHEVCGSPRCSASVYSSASTTTMQPAAEKWFRICDFSSPGLRMSMRSKFSALLLEMGVQPHLSSTVRTLSGTCISLSSIALDLSRPLFGCWSFAAWCFVCWA